MKLCILVAIPLLALLTMGSTDAVAPSADDGCVRGPEYVGAASCKKCHFSQWRSWSKTRMAKSLETLQAGTFADAKKKHDLDPTKDYSKDPSCLKCHTTGYGEPGGYPKLVPGTEWTDDEKKRAKEMGGVQCEACHGPHSLINPYKKDNEDYKKAKLLEMGLINPDAANCQLCHNERSPTTGKDYKFDYEALIKDPKKIHKHKKLKRVH